MVRTKATVQRLDDFRVVARYKKRTVYPFKIQLTLPAQKAVYITKNEQIIKTRYFYGKNRLIF